MSAPPSYPFSNQLSVQDNLMGQTSHPPLAQPWEWAPPSVPQHQEPHLPLSSLGPANCQLLDLALSPGLTGQVWGQIRSARELMTPRELEDKYPSSRPLRRWLSMFSTVPRDQRQNWAPAAHVVFGLVKWTLLKLPFLSCLSSLPPSWYFLESCLK